MWSTLINTTSGTAIVGVAQSLCILARTFSVRGQISGQWVNPKKSRLNFPLRSGVLKCWPILSINWTLGNWAPPSNKVATVGGGSSRSAVNSMIIPPARSRNAIIRTFVRISLMRLIISQGVLFVVNGRFGTQTSA